MQSRQQVPDAQPAPRKHLFEISYGSGTLFSAFYKTHLTFKATPEEKCYYYHRITDAATDMHIAYKISSQKFYVFICKYAGYRK